MTNDFINNLEKTVPGAFIDKKPEISWINQDSEIKNKNILLNSYDFPDLYPTIFIDPNTKILENDEELNAEIGERGMEALAWYVSFHQSKNNWGIYIRIRGLAYLSKFFKTKSNMNDINERVKEAFDLLFYHEFFHFLTDITSAHIEMSYKKPVYNKYLEFLNGDKKMNIEEPLANAYVLRRMPKKYNSKIRKIFRLQPDSYTQFKNYISDINFLEGKRKLGAIIRIQNTNEILTQALDAFPEESEPFWEFLFNVNPEKLFIPKIPIYFVSEQNHSNRTLEFITPIIHGTKIAVYVNDHPPPHMHIWIPADSKTDGRYLYPSLNPYMGSIPLSNQKRKKVEELIKIYKDKIKSDIDRQKNRKI